MPRIHPFGKWPKWTNLGLILTSFHFLLKSQQQFWKTLTNRVITIAHSTNDLLPPTWECFPSPSPRTAAWERDVERCRHPHPPRWRRPLASPAARWWKCDPATPPIIMASAGDCSWSPKLLDPSKITDRDLFMNYLTKHISLYSISFGVWKSPIETGQKR